MPARAVNTSAFDADQQRTIEDIYDRLDGLVADKIVDRRILNLGGSEKSVREGLEDLYDDSGFISLDDVIIERLFIGRTDPELFFNETDASDNERRWRFKAKDGSFLVSTIDSDWNVGTTFMEVSRTGTTVDEIIYRSPIRSNSDVTVNADIDGNTFSVDDTTVIDASRNLSAVAGTFTGKITGQAGLDLSGSNVDLTWFEDTNTIGIGGYLNGRSSGAFNAAINISLVGTDGGSLSIRTKVDGGGGAEAVLFGADQSTTLRGLLTAEAGIQSDGNIRADASNVQFTLNNTGTPGSTFAQIIFKEGGTNKAFIFEEGSSDQLRLRQDGVGSSIGFQIGGSVDIQFHDGGGASFGDTSMQGYTALYANGTVGLGGLLTVHDDIFPDMNYTSNIGSPVKKFLTAHIAELRAELMTIEERRVTTGGRFNVGLGNVLESDVGAADTSISVEYNNLNSGDIIHLEKVGQVEFMKVTSAASGTGPYSYDVTRDLDGTGANDWDAGDGVFNTAQTGSGFIDMYATTSLLTGVTTAGPTTAYMQRTGTAYNDIDVRAASGNIKGWYGVGSDEFGFAAGKYDSGAGNYIILTDQRGDLQIDTWNLETTTLILESTTPKLSMGAAAATLGLTSASDTGTFINGSGHLRAGTTDGSGNISKGFKFDGTNAILKANNAEIDTTSGWFGSNNILTYSASSVTLAGFTADSERISKTGNSNLYIGESLSAVDAEKTFTVGFWNAQGAASPFPIARIRASDTAGGINVVQMKYNTDSDWGLEGYIDGSQVFELGDELFVGGAYFDANDLWLGSATKGNATVLLDGTNGRIVTAAMGGPITNRVVSASFGRNNSVSTSNLTDNEWSTHVQVSGTASTSDSNTHRIIRYYKAFGINELIFTGHAKHTRTSSFSPTFTNDIEITVGSASTTKSVTTTGFSSFEITLDISGLTNGGLYYVQLTTKASVDASSETGASGSDNHESETHLREDIQVRETAT